jgi:hypothetical protein
MACPGLYRDCFTFKRLALSSSSSSSSLLFYFTFKLVDKTSKSPTVSMFTITDFTNILYNICRHVYHFTSLPTVPCLARIVR